jgi:hypothetical protein
MNQRCEDILIDINSTIKDLLITTANRRTTWHECMVHDLKDSCDVSSRENDREIALKEKLDSLILKLGKCLEGKSI